MIVSPASRILRAISFGVFCRSAPSTSAIMRSRNVSPGLEVILTFIWSESTLVPPVTAERSPPDSRITGADSPVMADSSTEATPSTTSTSPGMTSPGRHSTRSPDLRSLDDTVSTREVSRRSLSRLATVSRRVFRSSSACALPRPSAIASAKLANRTVDQSHNASWKRKPRSEPPATTSRISATVVNTLPTSTTNMTGFRTMWAGASFTNDSRIARLTMGGSNSGRLVAPILEEPPALHQQMLDDGSERPGREKREGAHDHDDADEEHHEQGRGDRKRPGGFRRDLLLREEARRGQHWHLHREAADERREAEHRVVVVRRAGQTGEGAAGVGRRRGKGVQDLGEPVRPRVVEALEPGREHH